MARTCRIKKDGDGHYHVMSRTNAKAFLFRSGRLKSEMVDLLQRSAAFSGIRLDAYAIMDNHFHAAVTVIKPVETITEKEILKRIAILKGDKAADTVEAHWARLRKAGLFLDLETAQNGWRRRMHDVSEFTKTFKELVNIHYKKTNKHCGSIWAGRFASTVVEGGKYWSVVNRYIELNAVRAKIVGQSKNYEWCSHATTTDELVSPYVVQMGVVLQTGVIRGTRFSATGAFRGDAPIAGMSGKIEMDPVWETRIMRRVVQIGAGKIFGGLAFVETMIGVNVRALPKGARARKILSDTFATHGWKLAMLDDKAA